MIYIASPANMSAESTAAISSHLSTQFNFDVDTIMDASTFFTQQFTSLGGWDNYIRHVAQGVNYLTRQPVFTFICCIQADVGRATGEIVQAALAAGKPVCLLLNHNSFMTLHKVTAVTLLDNSNWQSGWKLSHSPSLHQWDTV